MATIALKRKTPNKTQGSGGPRPEPLPQGKYRVEVVSADEVDDKYGGLSFNLKVLQGEYKDRVLERIRVFPASDALKSLVETLGGDLDSEEAELDLDELKGETFNAMVDIRKQFNTVTRFLPAPRAK